jgi:sugar O-acyltransferase (sialic acid O-acetyltransferase NeuD family)
MDVREVRIPLLNPNEPEALLAALHVREGQAVQPGDPLCTLETTKSTAEVTAEAGGYVAGLALAAGQTVRAGELLCYLAPSASWQPPQAAPPETASQASEAPAGLRISQKALRLAEALGVDLGRLPAGVFITEQIVRQHAAATASTAETPFDPTAILVYGGGGHGKSLIELLRALTTYRIVGVVDDGLPPGRSVLGIPLLGGAAALAEQYASGVRLAVNAVGGIGSPAVRRRVFERLAQAGFACPAAVHPTAWVEPSARLAAGCQVFPHAYVGADASVGFGAIVNTAAVVSHDCALGDYANVAPGALLAGSVSVGEGALVGMGVTVHLEVKIGAGARIGNGATVKADVPPGGVVRAGAVWPE